MQGNVLVIFQDVTISVQIEICGLAADMYSCQAHAKKTQGRLEYNINPLRRCNVSLAFHVFQ